MQVTDLQSPQSFLADPAGKQYFISNVNGEADARDNNGFITKLDADGKVTKLKFIHGGDGDIVLHAPKGMALVDRTLYVTDLDSLRGFDAGTGRPLLAVSFPTLSQSPSGRTTSLVDVTADGQGLLYVSDTGNNIIYRVDARRQYAVSVLVQDVRLSGPSGLAVHPKTGHIIAVSWEKGKILEITPDGTISELVSNGFFSARFENLSGVDFDRWGNMYVSDFTKGKIWRMSADKRFHVIAEYLPSPADISIDRVNHLILVPYHFANAAEVNGLESPLHSDSKNKKRTLADYGFTPPPAKPTQEGPAGK